jgi:hypothetical protein
LRSRRIIVSRDLEGRLRGAGEAFPEPDPQVTRSARNRALAAASSRRRRAPLALAAALAVGCALGIAVGATVVSSGRAAGTPPGFGFLPATGWHVVQSGGTPSPTQPVQAIATNVRLSPDDDPDGLPYSTLLSLPPRGVVIVAASAGRRDAPGVLEHPLRLPLRLRDAAPVAYGVEIRPGRPLGQYELRGIVNGQEVVVTVYFGIERPGRAVLAATQRQLDRLMVVAQPVVAADVTERALPLRSPAGGSARVIDRTLSCRTTTSGGVREIELSAYTGFRQGGRWLTLPFARVATGGVRSAANSLEDSLAWVAAGKYDHNANLTPSDGILLTNATRFGTWALNRGMCRPARASVPLSARGLRAATVDPLGVRFDCATPRQVLVRVRVVAHAAPARYREQQFEKTKASLQQGFIAVRTPGGKQLAFASVLDSGKVRLAVAPACRED